MKQKQLFIIIGVLVVLLIASVTWGLTSSAKAINPEEAKTKTENFINETLMVEGQSATINSITKEDEFYKMAVDIGQGRVVNSYLSLDGKLFFPQALEVTSKDDAVNDNSANTNSEPVIPENITKAETPKVELFTMSHCPFGTQMEKGILPVANLLEDKIDFEIKFVDYAMHGKEELDEQTNQYCIMQEEPDKFNEYLACFLEDGNTSACLKETNINTTSINSCIENTDNEYKITENFENKVNYNGSYPEFPIHKEDNVKYGVGGSPTLVINEQEVSTGRDSATLLATICSAFEGEAPEECDANLSSTSPSSGFGYNNGSSNTGAATCN